MLTYAELVELTYADIDFVLSWETLKSFVGASDADNDYVQRCWVEAYAMVQNYVGTAVVPVEAIGRAVIEVGSELFHRRNAPNGIAQYSTIDGSAIRVARDPMVGARPILQPFMPVGFA